MSRIDRNENPNNDDDFLRGALHGAADAMPGAGVDDLNVSFGVVRDRVRRRRAVKIGGVTGASLALVGVLAFGAAQTPLLDRNEPVLPGQSQSAFATPDPSGASSQEPDGAPSGPSATSVIQDGYAPQWIEDLGAGLECGMPAADLETTAAGWSVAAAGDLYARTSDQGGEPSTSWGMAATVEQDEGSLDVAPVLVWSQDGVVVDLGTAVFETPGQLDPLVGSAEGAVEAQGGAFTTCAPAETEARATFETPLPEGDYDVRVVAFPRTASGQWATAVSEPVSVRIDADGAHTETGTRGGDATIEPPEPAEGELSRFVLDRSTDWVTAELTQRGWVTTGTPAVTAQCASTDPADTVTYELATLSGGVFGSGEVPCDGSPFESGPVVGGGEEVVEIRLTSVPEGVSRLWATFGPTSGSGNAAGECSASDLGMDYDPATAPTEAAGATAATIVEAALACDSERLMQLATDQGTQLMFTTETPEQVFGLPEVDTLPYETVVRLLAGTGGVVNGGDPGNETITWPRVSTDEFADSDEAWAEVVSAGLLTQAEADAQRADETFGYTGMVIGIDESGTWRYYEPSNA